MNADQSPDITRRHPLDHIADATERQALARLLAARQESLLAQGREDLARRKDLPVRPCSVDLLPHALDVFVDLLVNGTLDSVDAAFVRAVEAADPALSLFDAAACLRHAMDTVARAALPPVLAEAGVPQNEHRGLALLLAARDAGGARLHTALTSTVLHEINAERERQMRFYREVVRVATNDRLRLVEPDEMPPPRGESQPLIDPLDASQLRHQALTLAGSTGMASARAEDFALAVGEAASNVLKHAAGGAAYAWHTEEAAFVFLTDAGQGITMDILPKALSPGWSSMPSLGMGFTLMMEMADILWLSTSACGTLVCIQQNVRPSEVPPLQSLLLDSLPVVD